MTHPCPSPPIRRCHDTPNPSPVTKIFSFLSPPPPRSLNAPAPGSFPHHTHLRTLHCTVTNSLFPFPHPHPLALAVAQRPPHLPPTYRFARQNTPLKHTLKGLSRLPLARSWPPFVLPCLPCPGPRIGLALNEVLGSYCCWKVLVRYLHPTRESARLSTTETASFSSPPCTWPPFCPSPS